MIELAAVMCFVNFIGMDFLYGGVWDGVCVEGIFAFGFVFGGRLKHVFWCMVYFRYIFPPSLPPLLLCIVPYSYKIYRRLFFLCGMVVLFYLWCEANGV